MEKKSLEKSAVLREKSKALISSIQEKQNELRQELLKLRSTSSKKTAPVVVKTVSFSDYPHENAAKRTKYRSKSTSPSRMKTTTAVDESSDLDSSQASTDREESYLKEIEEESTNNLADLIRFKELDTLERLKASSEDEFLKHVEAKRQSYLKRDYSDNETSSKNHKHGDVNIIRKKKTLVKSRSKSAPSYLRSTEASMNMARKKYCKDDSSCERVKPSKKSSKTVDSKNSTNTNTSKSGVNKNIRNKPLLGFDFALDSLETKSSLTNSKYQKSDEYWQQLCKFREENQDECVSAKPVNFDGTNSSLFLDQSNINEYLKSNDNELEDGVNHRCIHSFILNERLFPIPVYKDKSGQSVCPVCKSTRKEGNFFSPQFCKVSIPNYRLVEPISIEPSRKSNPRTEDTLSLSEHCVAGYDNAPKKSVRSYQTPPAKNIDLKSSTIDYKEINKRKPLTLTDLKLIEANRDPATAGIYSKANALRYELEDQHLKRLKELILKN